MISETVRRDETIETTGSSIIKSIGYNYKDWLLFVDFKSSKTYVYADCPSNFFLELKEAIKAGQSIGKIYNNYIKGKFKTVQF